MPLTDHRSRRIILWAAVYATIVPALVATVFMRSSTEIGAAMSFPQVLAWQLLVLGSWVAAFRFMRWIVKRESERENTSWRGILSSLLAGAPIAVAHGGFAASVDIAFGVDRGFADAWIARLPVDFLIIWALTSVAHAFATHLRLLRKRTESDRLEARLVSIQLRELKDRLQPHFLFNTLNALTVLIRKEPDAAVEMTRSLATLLRAILARQAAEFVSLQDELTVLNEYLAIERIRFGDRLSIRFAVPDGLLHVAVPDLILLPIVENAVKHGIAPTIGPAEVRISADSTTDGRIRLMVEDSGLGYYAGTTDGIGLQTTRERLGAMYGSEAEFEIGRADGGGTRAVVTLPTKCK